MILRALLDSFPTTNGEQILVPLGAAAASFLATFGAMFQRVKNSERQREEDKKEFREGLKEIVTKVEELEHQFNENLINLVKDLAVIKDRLSWMSGNKTPTTPPPWTSKK